MAQDGELEDVIRARIRGLRVARGWSLETLAGRSFMNPSSLSRLETGGRRIALDQLIPLARALETSVDQLLDPIDDEDVIIRPQRDRRPGRTVWTLSRADHPGGSSVAKIRLTARHPAGPQRVHPGFEWLTVLSGAAILYLGDRVIHVETGEGAQFSTMTPHAISAHGGPVEFIVIFDRDGRNAHLNQQDQPH